MKKKVLFVCIHNSARSQMAEAFLKQLGGEKYEVESAGLEPGELSQLVVESMKEIGIDISQNKTKSVFDFYKQDKKYDYVITVCDAASGERCPIFPGATQRIHWSFDDPGALIGSHEEKLSKVRIIREEVLRKVEDFIKEND
ncbi:MAG: arsenate reductase ArsC [Candidatus Saganbacteria bacterium]|nr:arsenate reductase ArsC [Candidatus Saganbacteria bacterium]